MVDFLLDFIQQNASWVIAISFAIAFAESLAFVGILIPGWALLVGIGSLIGSDLIGFYPTLIGVYLGAVLGEYLSFYLGYHYHQSILNWRLAKKYQQQIDSTQNFFQKHGVASVFFGRFLGPTRAVIPFVAGVAQMSKHQFFWVNIISGVLWAPLNLAPGILLATAFSLEKQQAYQLTAVLFLVAVTYFVSGKYWLAFLKQKKSITPQQTTAGQTISHRWVFIKACLSTLIAVISSLIFYYSEYWQILLSIFRLVFAKL